MKTLFIQDCNSKNELHFDRSRILFQQLIYLVSFFFKFAVLFFSPWLTSCLWLAR